MGDFCLPELLKVLSSLENNLRSGKTPPKKCRLYLPELLQFVDLLGRDLAGAELLLLRGDLHQPREEAAVLDQGLPLGAVPVDVLQAALAGTGLPAAPKHSQEIEIRPEGGTG